MRKQQSNTYTLSADFPASRVCTHQGAVRGAGQPAGQAEVCSSCGHERQGLDRVHDGLGTTSGRTAHWTVYLAISGAVLRAHPGDGVMISDDDLTRLCERVTVACESLTLAEGETIGEFEFTTALAFLCFVEQECDIVVLETGLGGRCDATNVIKDAEVCVITPISLKHMAVLGNTTAVVGARRQVFSSRVRQLSARTVSRTMYSGCCAVPATRRALSGSAERRTAAYCGVTSAVRRSCTRRGLHHCHARTA